MGAGATVPSTASQGPSLAITNAVDHTSLGKSSSHDQTSKLRVRRRTQASERSTRWLEIPLLLLQQRKLLPRSGARSPTQTQTKEFLEWERREEWPFSHIRCMHKFPPSKVHTGHVIANGLFILLPEILGDGGCCTVHAGLQRKLAVPRTKHKVPDGVITVDESSQCPGNPPVSWGRQGKGGVDDNISVNDQALAEATRYFTSHLVHSTKVGLQNASFCAGGIHSNTELARWMNPNNLQERRMDEVAIKWISKEQVEKQKKGLGFIEEEMKLLRELCGHPAIVRCLDAFENSDQSVCIVMERVRGGPLVSQLIRHWRHRCFTEEVARRVVKDMLGAVAHLHSHHVAHRDIQHANFLMEDPVIDEHTGAIKHLELKLMDFSSAAKVDANFQGLTALAGSPMYIAPEVLLVRQQAGESYGTQCDIWSVGVILFSFLGGRRPFLGSISGVLKKIVYGFYEFDQEKWATVSSAAKELVQRMLVKDPHERITASEALENPWITAPEGSFLSHQLQESLMSIDSSRPCSTASDESISGTDEKKHVTKVKRCSRALLLKKEFEETVSALFPAHNWLTDVANDCNAPFR